MSSAGRNVALVTLGCARNEVDSEELAGRLGAGGWTITDDTDTADVVMVNTCGFIESAKTDSIDELFRHTGGEQKVVAVGCMAERYGSQLAEAFTEGTVLGFDSYADIAARLDDVAAGRPVAAHQPRDRRTLLPVSPAKRQEATDVSVPGHGWVPDLGGIARHRADDAPVAYLKLASGCDRRCTFCAIPSFRGSFVSRKPADVLAEAAWLAGTGVRELVLVSENSTSYGKDLGDLRALEALLPDLAAVEGIERIRVSYLQPAEMRPGLIAAIAGTPGVAPYFDLSFQHASEPVLRRMKRFGGTAPFLDLLRRARDLAPDLGARSNFIVGFPGETEADVDELEEFLAGAGLDAIGVFGYSDEDGTDAADFENKIDPDVIAERKERIQRLADELVAQRAEDRVGTRIEVLVEEVDTAEDGTGGVFGRGAHQGPEVDGSVRLVGEPVGGLVDGGVFTRGQIVPAFVVASEGVDLVAEPAGTAW